NGQLGRGGATTSEEPVPALVTGLTDAVEIAAGGLHACARTTAGEVRCWGRTANTGVGFGVLQGTSPLPVVTGRETTSPP
ncbi:MAG: hypothetical protein GWN73_00455, partial [Actinobacteria bacterium]|nr:hypothetical protein [Actinomycetota bacterium]NIU63990.1 hypothetical protein [Actinomycetota bacterium]NIV85411.1 hypothetical protein [Actinomycetota bacterium]NIW25788.1 hypothetical protein [Actinomycetota bacterium]